MGLTGKNVEEKIWNFLIGKGFSKAGAAGLMGNLFAESGLNPKNLQNSFEKKLGHTDDSYTAAVDNGTYSNFVKDSAGYGLAQWTYWSRKQNMLGLHEPQASLSETWKCSSIFYLRSFRRGTRRYWRH